MKPKKERPSALPDSIFQASGHVPEDIPVHNTFIQFGAPPSAGDQKKPLLTAPAWIGPSFQSIIQQAAAEPPVASRQEAEPPCAGALPPEAAADSFFAPMEGNGEPFFQPEDEDGGQEVLPLGSPQKIPMRYALSAASSNRTAGLPDWSPSAVATVGTPVSNFVGVADDNDLEHHEVDGAQASRAAVQPPPPGGPPPGPLPSMGSVQHAEGACKRCCFFPKGRCQNGYNCEFCHFEHEKRKRKKKKKGARKADGQGDESEDESDDGETEQGAPGIAPNTPPSQQASSTRPGRRAARGDERGGGAWQPEPIGPMRSGMPLTAPPLLPPRGLPPPTEPPPPMPGIGMPAPPIPGMQGLGDPFYGSSYDLPGGAGGAYNPLGGYGGGGYGAPDGRLSGLGGVGINQSYFGGGYDPAAVAAQQQHAAYQQQPTGRYLPPPR